MECDNKAGRANVFAMVRFCEGTMANSMQGCRRRALAAHFGEVGMQEEGAEGKGTGSTAGTGAGPNAGSDADADADMIIGTDADADQLMSGWFGGVGSSGSGSGSSPNTTLRRSS